MYRIDDATAATTLPTPESANAEGYFTEGNPATGTPATKVRASWLNMLQEELRGVVVGGGLTPSKTTYNQVYTAIQALIKAAAQGISSTGNISTTGKVNGVNSANLLINSSAELGNSGWSSSNFVPFLPPQGNFGEGTYWFNNAAISSTTQDISNAIPMVAGVSLVLSAEITATGVAAGRAYVYMEAFNSSGASLGGFGSAFAQNGTGWTRYSVVGTTPAGTASVNVHRVVDSSPTVSAGGVAFRRIKLEQGTQQSLYSQEASIATLGGGMPVVGSVRNLRMYVATASATATITADEIIACSALGGVSYKVGGISQSINLAAANGIGGMDTGSAPTNGYVAIYEMVNPSTGAKGLMAVNATSSVAPSVYGGSSAPAGYTASGLLTVVPTNGSGQFKPVLVNDRWVNLTLTTVFSSATPQVSPTAISIAATVAPNARSIRGELQVSSSAASQLSLTVVADSTNQMSQQNITGQGGILYAGNFAMDLLNTQQIYYTASNTVGTSGFQIYVGAYAI
ncbi:hypothetical protein [Burkholderia stabilis]